jgi:hypothetical protein
MLTSNVVGQINKDSTNISTDSSLINVHIEYSKALLQNDFFLDTSLYLFNRFEPTNPFFNSVSSLGNIGLPHHNLSSYFNEHKLFNIGEITLSRYWFDNEINRTYKSLLPFSEVLYVSGGNQPDKIFIFRN